MSWGNITDLPVLKYAAIQQATFAANWGGNVQYWTELVICLNWKIWQWYNKNDELAKLYNTLWEQADEYARDTFTGDDLDYFYTETD